MINKTFPITEKLIKNGLGLSLRLLDLLSKEAENLQNRTDATAISKIAVNKKETVTQLEQFSKQFSQVLSTEKLHLTPDGVAEYFNKAELANLVISETTRQWDEIMSISKQCRLLNEKNGASINILAKHTHRSLLILKGKSQQATTYGPDGSTYSERLTSSLASA